MWWIKQKYMNAVYKNIITDKILLIGFALSFVFCLISITMLLFSYNHLPPLIPLFNQFPWGDARLGTPLQFFIPCILGFMIFIINFFLANFVYTKLPLLARILSLCTLLCTFFVFLFTFQTLQLIL